MLAFPITTLSPSLPWKSRIQLVLRHHNASLIVNSSSSASTLPESNQGKGQLRENESFTVSYLMSSLGMPRNVATEVSKKVELKDPNKPNSVINLFRSYGFSDTQISNLVKRLPRVLLSKPEKNLLPRLRFLQSVGFTNSELQDLLISNYSLLKVSLKECLIPCHENLMSYLDNEKEAKIAFRHLGWFRSSNTVANIDENIKVLRDIGVPQSSVSLMLTKFVLVAFLDHTKFVEYVNFAREAGVDPSKSVFINAISALSQLKESTWNSKLDIFKRFGWTRDVTLSVFRRQPQCLLLSEENITKSMSFLVDEMGIPSTRIARNPGLLLFSLERRIIPRYSVIEVLKMKGLVRRKLSFNSLFRYSEEKFVDKFVTRFQENVPELLNIYKGSSGLSEVQ